MNDDLKETISKVLDEHTLLYLDKTSSNDDVPLNPDGPTSTVIFKGDIIKLTELLMRSNPTILDEIWDKKYDLPDNP